MNVIEREEDEEDAEEERKKRRREGFATERIASRGTVFLFRYR